MKKIKLFTILLVVGCSFIACSDDSLEKDNVEQSTQQLAKSERYKPEEVEAFKKLIVDHNLVILTDKWRNAIKNDDIELTINTHKEIVNTVDVVKKKWSGNFDDMLLYVGEIEKAPTGSHDGNPCTRNLDGSNYYDTCTWFGEVVVAIRSIGCSAFLENMTPGTKDYMLDQYEKCVQDKICKTC